MTMPFLKLSILEVLLCNILVDCEQTVRKEMLCGGL